MSLAFVTIDSEAIMLRAWGGFLARHARATLIAGIIAVIAAAAYDVVAYYDTHAPDLVSSDRHATRVIITLAGADQDAKADSYFDVEDRLDAEGLTTDVAGQWAVFGDVDDTVAKDIERAEALSMPIVFLLSLVI